MSAIELRPLSLGELLDRAFSIYRRHFWLFAGIVAIPRTLVLPIEFAHIALRISWRRSVLVYGSDPQARGFVTLAYIAVVVVAGVTDLVAQGAAAISISEMYLGRRATISAALRAVWPHLGTIIGMAILACLATGAGLIVLIIPGIYIAVRLSIGVQALVLEDIGSLDALRRSWALTKSCASRPFLIYVLYLCLVYGAAFLLSGPLGAGVYFARSNPSVYFFLSELILVTNYLALVLAMPFLTIAMALFYYDTRVRKEALDLQVMVDPESGAPPSRSVVPSMFF